MFEDYLVKKYKTKNVDGFNWILDIDDGGIGSTLYRSHTSGQNYSYSRECIFMEILNQTVREGMVCVDLGANIGYATMFMLRNTGTSGYVYAIEPDDHNLEFLERNIELNNYSKVEISRCVITDHDGDSSFWIARHPNLNSVNKTEHSIREEKIPCFTLNTFCSSRKYPNFIKMDIEGHEVSVFESGYKYFKKNKGETHFLLEVHAKEYNEQNDFAKILKKYEEIGFKIKKIIATPVSNPAPFKNLGYKPDFEMLSDGWTRSIYTNVENDHAIEISTNLHNDVYGAKAVRAILLSREE